MTNFRSIRRIIFYSLTKPTTNEKGEREIDIISVSSALQIAGEFVTIFHKTFNFTIKLI